MSILKLFTASVLVTLTAVSVTTAAEAAGRGFPPRVPARDLTVRADDERSVGTASSMRSCETPTAIKNYSPPAITGSTTMPQLLSYYQGLLQEYNKLKRHLSNTNQQMRTFLETQGGVLREIDGLVTDTDETRLRRTVEQGIRGLVRLYTELQAAHEALQSRSEEQTTRIAALESRVHTLEEEKVGLERTVRVLTRAEEEARAREEAARASAESHMRSPLLGEKGEKPKSDGCCSVQ